MTAPLRIQRKRTKGWRMPPGTRHCGRPTIYGNPFSTVELFDRWLAGRGWINGWLLYPEQMSLLMGTLFQSATLRGKNLACWCGICDVHKDGKPLGVECPDCQPCHADVLLELANQ